MESVENPTRALRKLRRLARVRKENPMQGEQKPPETPRQQMANEFPTRQPGDWPPNTWWP